MKLRQKICLCLCVTACMCVCIVYCYKKGMMCGLWAVMEYPVSLMWWTWSALYTIKTQSIPQQSSFHTSCSHQLWANMWGKQWGISVMPSAMQFLTLFIEQRVKCMSVFYWWIFFRHQNHSKEGNPHIVNCNAPFFILSCTCYPWIFILIIAIIWGFIWEDSQTIYDLFCRDMPYAKFKVKCKVTASTLRRNNDLTWRPLL